MEGDREHHAQYQYCPCGREVPNTFTWREYPANRLQVQMMEAGQRQWRSDTPGCSNRNHLNNAGAALMPVAVMRAIAAHLDLEAQIGGYEAADLQATEIERGYGDIATLLGTAARNVAIVANATAGFIQAISSFDFAPGEVIITSRSDYTSNQIQYLALQQRRGVSIIHAADLPEGGIDSDSVRDLLKRHACRLVAVSWVPTNSGLVQDVEAVGRVCGDFDVPYLVDACQAVGQIPIDVKKLNCDYLSVTARKFLRGPRGIGFLYASDRALARGDYPLFVDMRGARWVNAGKFEIDPTARRFEDWEFPYALVLGLGEAVRYALEIGISVVQTSAWDLASYARSRLRAIPGLRLFDRGRKQCAIVTAALAGWTGGEIVAELAKLGINTSASLREYGILDFDSKGVDSVVRISPHYYNTREEIDQLTAAMTDISAQGR
jgi:selenocysteine lyase/cysteine desulfurase